MTISIVPATFDEILAMRNLYRQEMNCQIIHDSLPGRGFGVFFILRIDHRIAGYGFVMGYQGESKDMIREFYVLPAYRGSSLKLFRLLIQASNARRIEVQSNDNLLTLMLYDCSTAITSDRIIFADALTTSLQIGDANVRETTDADRQQMFEHHVEGIGDWILEIGSQIVATGGIATHYNPPYGDIYMEVDAQFRRRGYGSYLIQELKRICYENGRIPAARCDVSNTGSRAALEKAGLLPCARVLNGVLNGSVTGDL